MSKHILIIDDALTETRVYKSLLEAQGYQVSIASNGQEGIETAQSMQPDIIVMDVVMPLVNGFQATRELTRKQATAHIPIIVYSSKSSKTDKLWALRQGAKAYLVKPVKAQELLTEIKRQLAGIRMHEQPV